ncbi:MAG TPA: hypothetical protein VGM88_06645 [Kofleriaceae bacterium]|jgi:hypothetical protein
MRWLVAIALLAGCGADCPHAARCDGNVLVGCAENADEDSYSEYRQDCATDTCVQLDDDAFCSWKSAPAPACEALPSGGDMTPACVDNVPSACEGGYPEGTIDTACTDTCVECDASFATGGTFAGCGLGSGAEPACDATTKSACDGATRFDCTCGWRYTELACAASCVDVEHGGFGYALCAFDAAPDPSCPTPSATGDSAYCTGDTLTRCFLGYAVQADTCMAGQCTPGGCTGLPVSVTGESRGGVQTL